VVKKNLVWKFAIIVGTFLLMALADSQTVEAQKTKGKTHPAETKYLMRGVVQAHCAGIGGLLKDAGPADDKAWDTVACHASILNEMSYVLMSDGRCPDKVWAEATKNLGECSAKVLDAAKEKKLDDARDAFKGVTAACAACHTVHRPKK